MTKHFVNLHAHSGYSVGDGLGAPSKHIDYAISQGLKAHAFTDHGNMSNVANAELHMRKIREKNPDFKVIRGVEAYFVPSLTEWQQMKDRFAAEAEQDKTDDDDVGTVVENEEETKSGGGKTKNENLRALRQRGHLVILAKNAVGLKNLYQLTSKSFTKDNFYYYPRIDFDLLRRHREGLIVSSACIGGAGATLTGFWPWQKDGIGNEADVMKKQRELYAKFQAIFGENFFLELQWNAIPEQHVHNKMLIDIGKDLGIPLISTADCHYPDPKLWKEREVYKKLAQLGKTKDLTIDDLPTKLSDMPYELFPKNAEQMIEAYERYSKQCGVYYNDSLIHDSIFRTGQISDSIENYKLDTTIRLPTCFTPKGKTATEHLKELCESGLSAKGLSGKMRYQERLYYELGVIDARGMSEYFLTMKAVVDTAKKTGLVGCGRGSAAGSLISYLTNITQIDPIRFDLQFERFITVDDPTSFPDIDTDFEEPAELKELLAEEWKKKYDLDVIPISNYNTLKLRNLLKDICKLQNVPFQEVNDITNKIFAEATKPAKIKHDVESGMYEPNFEDAVEFSPSFRDFLKKYPTVANYLGTLAGEIRSTSRHAAGTLIAENLNEQLPLIAAKGLQQTPFTEGQRVRELEPMGFLKFDFLGLATLRMVNRAIELILEKDLGYKPSFKECEEYYNKYLHPDVLDLNDQKVYEEVYHAGKWIGVFQFAQRPVQQFAKKVRPTSIVQLSDVTAIYRPGPLAAGVDKKYLETADQEYKKYPALVEVFDATKGHLIYQETISKFANVVGDFSLAEGNKLRKLLTKKGIGDTKEKLEKYKKGILENGQKKGIPAWLLNQIWVDIERSSQYLFNFSHSLSYSINSFQCAWLLTYHPLEWCCAFLDKEPIDRKEAAIAAVKSNGYEIGELSLNKSDGYNWRVVDDKLIPPLSSVKGLGDSAISELLKYRPFASIDELIHHPTLDYRKFSKKGLDSLSRAGALNFMIDKRFTGTKHFWASLQMFDRKAAEKKKKPKFFQDFIDEAAQDFSGDFSKTEVINNTVELTGLFPVELVATPNLLRMLNSKGVPPISEFDPDLLVAWLIPREVIQKATGKGKPYYIVKATDINSAFVEIKCWGVDLERDQVYTDRVYAVKLQYDDTWGFSTNGGLSKWKLLS